MNSWRALDFFQFDFNSLGYRFRFKSPPPLDDSFQRIWWPTRSELRIEHQVCGFSSQKIRSDFGSIGHYTDLAQFLFDLRRLLEETRPHSVVYFGAPSVFRSWCGPLHNFSTCASASVSNRLPDVFSDLFVNEECPKSHQGDSI